MLGQPISMLIPPVLGFRLHGRMLEGATATDLVLTITERLRKHGVVGKFVEFFGPGLEHLTIADRATLGNMCPEYGATIAIFPIDEMTLDYLRLTGRDDTRVELVDAYAKAQGHLPQARRSGSDLLGDHRAGSRDASSRVLPGRDVRRIACRSSRRRAGSRVLCPVSDREETRIRAGYGRRSSGPGLGCGSRRPAGRRSARPRFRGDRRDHELHEHVESERDDWRGPAREESRRARPQAPAVGQDQPGARVEGRDRVSAAGRARHLPRRARLQPGRLRLHDLHRQQRAAAGRRVGGGRRDGTSSWPRC